MAQEYSPEVPHIWPAYQSSHSVAHQANGSYCLIVELTSNMFQPNKYEATFILNPI